MDAYPFPGAAGRKPVTNWSVCLAWDKQKFSQSRRVFRCGASLKLKISDLAFRMNLDISCCINLRLHRSNKSIEVGNTKDESSRDRRAPTDLLPDPPGRDTGISDKWFLERVQEPALNTESILPCRSYRTHAQELRHDVGLLSSASTLACVFDAGARR